MCVCSLFANTVQFKSNLSILNAFGVFGLRDGRRSACARARTDQKNTRHDHERRRRPHILHHLQAINARAVEELCGAHANPLIEPRTRARAAAASKTIHTRRTETSRTVAARNQSKNATAEQTQTDRPLARSIFARRLLWDLRSEQPHKKNTLPDRPFCTRARARRPFVRALLMAHNKDDFTLRCVMWP